MIRGRLVERDVTLGLGGFYNVHLSAMKARMEKDLALERCACYRELCPWRR